MALSEEDQHNSIPRAVRGVELEGSHFNLCMVGEIPALKVRDDR